MKSLAIVPLLACALASNPGFAAEPEKPQLHTRTIYLVRHGSYLSDPNVDPEIGPGISALGIAQARLTAARLNGLPARFDSLTSSTMSRAMDTAAVIRETIGGAPALAAATLSECTPPAFREFEGKTPEELAACAARLDAEFAQRFRPATGADQEDLVVVHGNVIRYFVTKAIGVDTRNWTSMSVQHASLTIIRVRPDGSIKVLAVGDAGHIPPNLQRWATEALPTLVVPVAQEAIAE